MLQIKTFPRSLKNVSNKTIKTLIYYLWITTKDRLVDWLVVLRINVDLAIFQPFLDLETGDNQSLKVQVVRPGMNPDPLAPQTKSLTTRPPLLPQRIGQNMFLLTILPNLISKGHAD